MEFNKSLSSIEQHFLDACIEVVSELGYELYDMEYIKGSTTLRVFIRDPKTKSAVIEDCVKVDRALTPYFEQDWVPESIVLEVSSPGVYRNLKTYEHFEEASGENVLLFLNTAISQKDYDQLPKKLNKTKKLRGILKEINNNKVKLDINGYEIMLDFGQIKKASLDPDL